MPLTPTEHYAAVAEELFVEFDEDAPEWNACQMGRWRSAISRAYYSAFLALKARLIAVRSTDFPKRFPQTDVHGKLRSAVGQVLGDQPGSIAKRLFELSKARNDADYDWWGTHPLKTDVELHLRRADKLRRDIDSVHAKDMGDIALALLTIEQAAQVTRGRK